MLPTVEFRTGVDDKIAYAARWLRVAWSRGACIRVIGAATDLKLLDNKLWLDDPQDFVPHAWARDAARVPGLQLPRIWLGTGARSGPVPSLLLNIGDESPQELSAIERVVEVVSPDPTDAAAGRMRWKQYVQRGLAPAHRKAGPRSLGTCPDGSVKYTPTIHVFPLP